MKQNRSGLQLSEQQSSLLETNFVDSVPSQGGVARLYVGFSRTEISLVGLGVILAMNRLFKTPIAAVAAIVLVATTLFAALIVHSISANIYYNLNFLRLQIAADLAVRAGAEYLPTDPHTAAQVAAVYAKYNGIAASEIAIVGVDADKRTLRIHLYRKIPIYISFFALELPRRDIAVTASAQIRSDEGRYGRHLGASGSLRFSAYEAGQG